MNERIKLLAEQARKYAWENETHWSADAEREVLFEQKFAELIVQDCASICAINGQSYKHSFTPAKARLAESTSNHCSLMIKKHFGVEE